MLWYWDFVAFSSYLPAVFLEIYMVMETMKYMLQFFFLGYLKRFWCFFSSEFYENMCFVDLIMLFFRDIIYIILHKIWKTFKLLLIVIMEITSETRYFAIMASWLSLFGIVLNFIKIIFCHWGLHCLFWMQFRISYILWFECFAT